MMSGHCKELKPQLASIQEQLRMIQEFLHSERRHVKARRVLQYAREARQQSQGKPSRPQQVTKVGEPGEQEEKVEPKEYEAKEVDESLQ